MSQLRVFIQGGKGKFRMKRPLNAILLWCLEFSLLTLGLRFTFTSNKDPDDCSSVGECIHHLNQFLHL